MARWLRPLALLALSAAVASAASVPVEGEDPAVGDVATPGAPPPYDCAGPSSTGDSFIDYDHLVHCNPALQRSPVLGKAALVLCLVLLLYLLSSTADEFFCPVLQAIVEKYRIPPHVAGVTFLSFGNGSPDVFSNIAAFATPTPSIGVTAILGGGLLVTTEDSIYAVLDDDDDLDYLSSSTASENSPAGSPLIFPAKVEQQQPQQQQTRRPYLKSQTIPVYDTFTRTHIFSDSEQSEPSPRFLDRMLYRKSSVPTPRSKPHISDDLGPIARVEGQSLLEVTDVHLKRPSSMCVGSMQDSLRRIRRQRRRRKTAWESLESSAQFGATARRWTRGYHTLSDIDEFPPSMEAGGEEVETEVECETSDEEAKRKEVEAKADAAEEAQLALEARLAATLFDRAKVQVKRWRRLVVRAGRCVYWAFERLVWNPFEVLTVFVRRLTIPLVDEDTWDKNLVVVCPPFAMLLFGISVFSFSIEDPVFLMTVVAVGGIFSVVIEYTTSPLAPPEGWQLAPFICLAFVMSVIWIMNIANEVLAVLETLGELFGISSSVLGVSVSLASQRVLCIPTLVLTTELLHTFRQVLAWGNSIGDLVSNMAIARDGFPTMAFAGCFAGPMFNLLIGIGLSLTIAIISRGPLSMGEPSPLVYLGFGYLLLSLLLNIGIASYDGFQYRPRLCYTLLTLYASFAVISIAFVPNYPEDTSLGACNGQWKPSHDSAPQSHGPLNNDPWLLSKYHEDTLLPHFDVHASLATKSWDHGLRKIYTNHCHRSGTFNLSTSALTNLKTDWEAYVSALAMPTVIDMTQGGHLDMDIGQASHDWTEDGAISGQVYGYAVTGITPTFPGPSIVVAKDVPIGSLGITSW
ncbi:unnamed protein product [Phytophthora lilii]|uniref:Unnamed protein product n=1 Tax=Phytophthora lilii TaxID=2077276 RepID=A0A9W6UE77_9STRA|nr:unnamed protein product [Phytophthora lilii]